MELNKITRNPKSAGHVNATLSESSELFGQPRGLFVLASTEFWDRVSFHGMLAILVLYMVEQLFRPGHMERVIGFVGMRNGIEAITGPLSAQALATQVFGLYVGMIYLTPLFGGILGDRFLGRRRTVILGAVLMSFGHFCMVFDQSFFVALLLLILGAGCLRGNLSSQVGDLYRPDERRRADGFQIYVAMVNMGAFVAPLVTGALAQAYTWHYGFGFAGCGMLFGLVTYIVGSNHVPADTRKQALVSANRLVAHEHRRIIVLCLMIPVISLFWIAQSQVWNTYNLWARDHVDLAIGTWRFPVPWLQAVDGLAAVSLALPLILFWRWQARKGIEPDDVAKLGIGCVIFGLAMAWLAAGALFSDSAGKVPLVWALAFHFIENTGYLFVAPIAVSLFSRAAPRAVNAVMVSVYYLSIFIGSAISGRLGGLYEQLSPTQFWLLHALIVGAGGGLFILFSGHLRRELLLARTEAGAAFASG